MNETLFCRQNVEATPNNIDIAGTSIPTIFSQGVVDPLDGKRHVRVSPTGAGGTFTGTTHLSNNVPANAFDGTIVASYVANVMANISAYLQVQTPNPIRVTSFALLSCRGGSNQAGVATFRLSASDNGVDFTEVYLQSARRKNSILQGGNYVGDVYFNMFDVTAKYWRFNCLTTWDTVNLPGRWMIQELMLLERVD